MKLLKTLSAAICAVALMLPASTLQAQNCTGAVFTDDYSNATNWTIAGNNFINGVLSPTPGDVSVTGGNLFWDAFRGRQTYRLFQNMNGAISNTNVWRAEFDFTVTSTTNNLGAWLLVVSENSDHPRSASSGSAVESNNSNIRVMLGNPQNTSGQYRVTAGSKYQTTPGANSANISINANVHYYARLERQGPAIARLSIYTDAARTQHIAGSPTCFDIDERITDLDFVQHCVSTTSYAQRTVDATQDNLCIFRTLGGELCAGVEDCMITADLTYELGESACEIIFTDNSSIVTTGPAVIHIDFGDGTSGTMTPGGSISHTYPGGTQSVQACITIFGYDAEMNCCMDQSCVEFELDCPVEEPQGKRAATTGTLKDGKLELFPNPANEKLSFTSTDNITEIIIHNANGQIVYKNSEIDNNSFDLNINDLSSGVYIIVADVAGDRITRKFVKE